ncbi:MAG TPA: hypothetical protein VGL53_10005 [Bryobacteraceae bacterium]|jgi:hypothetical protein
MRILLLIPIALLTGCITQPQTYAPPVQREPVLDGQAPKPPKHILQMSDRETDAYIVQDIPRGSADPWRWTGKRPTVRMFVGDPNGLKLTADYSIAEATFKDTGPVKLTFYVNDKPLATVDEKEHGVKHFEKPIPREMLKASADNLFAIEIDKVWIAKQDGAHLGFILASIGLAPVNPSSKETTH